MVGTELLMLQCVPQLTALWGGEYQAPNERPRFMLNDSVCLLS
jgi:hypothetical protein